VYLWVRVDAAHPPAQVHHRLLITRGAADSIKETLEGTTIPVTPRAVEIAPPFSGQWAALNGPSDASGHRRLVLALNGADASAQRFAIDYLKVDSTGKSYSGDRTKNSSYYAYGTEIHAVADGIVVETKDSIPENVPGKLPPVSLVTVGGNHIVVDIGNQKFAFYAHVQPGSLRVKVGDHVKKGQVIALLGNSGNSTEPHLHFHVSGRARAGHDDVGLGRSSVRVSRIPARRQLRAHDGDRLHANHARHGSRRHADAEPVGRPWRAAPLSAVRSAQQSRKVPRF
jgi:hypothetical protein